MTDAPAQQWSGMPPEPENDVAFWVRDGDGQEFVAHWYADTQEWGEGTPKQVVEIEGWTLLGPALRPAEVEAKIAEWRELAERRLQLLDEQDAEAWQREREAELRGFEAAAEFCASPQGLFRRYTAGLMRAELARRRAAAERKGRSGP